MTTGVVPRQKADWRRHFFYRKESLKTTWKLRLLLIGLIFLILFLPRHFWIVKVGESLTCTEKITPSDGLLVENFDPDYLVLERAATLQRSGISSKIYVPISSRLDSETPSGVWYGITELLADYAHIPTFEPIPIQEIEPISLNAAKQIRDFLQSRNVRSVVVVTPGFRSRRSFLVYSSVLSPAGIEVGCAPVFGINTVTNWSKTWHGIEDVAEQWGKLLYYRFYVLL